jgi:hypothetical protein
VRSESSGLKVAARLSPPLSTMMRSRSVNSFINPSIAERFMDASSRIAVCGQPPVSTPRILSGLSASLRIRKSASSRV